MTIVKQWELQLEQLRQHFRSLEDMDPIAPIANFVTPERGISIRWNIEWQCYIICELTPDGQYWKGLGRGDTIREALKDAFK